jgi:ADP-heptose:LPS heptosyltransferase
VNTWLKAIPTWLQFLHPKVLRGRCIIIERNGGLGDVLCLLPALAALRRKCPDARLMVITSRPLMPIVQQAQVANVVLASGTRGLAWLRKKAHALIDCCVLIPDELEPPQPRARVHLMEEFARILGVSGQPLVYPQIAAPPPLAYQRVGALLKAAGLGHRPLVVIHSGPTWPVKQWPLDSWQTLTARLQSECGVDVIQAGLDGHPSDPAACTPRVPGAHDWVNRLTLSETSALLTQAKLVIAIDSGLLHLANALRVPALGLFGPTDPAYFMPSDRVELGMQATLPCIGCHHHADGPLHWRTGCPHHIQCMSALSVEAVMERCRQLLPSS